MGLIREGGTAVPQPSVVASLDQKMSEAASHYDVNKQGDAKSRQIKISGVIQAAAQAPVLQMFVTNYEEWWHLVEKTADNMLAYIDKKVQ